MIVFPALVVWQRDHIHSRSTDAAAVYVAHERLARTESCMHIHAHAQTADSHNLLVILRSNFQFSSGFALRGISSPFLLLGPRQVVSMRPLP